MASPQLENGYVKVANEIVQQLARVNLYPYEWRVIWAVIRKTWGWNKKTDTVALSQIVEMTGMRQPHVSRAKASLLKKRILFEQAGKISFQKNYELWTVKGFDYTSTGIKTAESYTDSGRKYTDTGINPIPNQGDTKDKKDTIQKKVRAGSVRTSFSFVLRSRKRWRLPQAKLDEYKGTFPKLDVGTELRKAAQWLTDNPDRRKTAKGMTRFLGGWLGRAKPSPEPKRGDPDWLPSEEEADALLKEVGQ